MVTGHCRLLQQTDPRKVKLQYGKNLWSEVFDNNPRIAGRDEVGDFQIFEPRPNGLRPYIKAKDPYRWTWQEYKPIVGELYFKPDELKFAEHFAPDVVIEPTVKRSASPNKQWGGAGWQSIIKMLLKAGYRPVQFGPRGTMVLRGVKHIETPSFRKACAILAKAKFAILHEGGLHHAAAVLGVPAVVIYGGFISPAQTGYDLHRNIFTGGEACGKRQLCPHCENAMAKITPEMVFEEFNTLVNDKRPVAA